MCARLRITSSRALGPFAGLRVKVRGGSHFPVFLVPDPVAALALLSRRARVSGPTRGLALIIYS